MLFIVSSLRATPGFEFTRPSNLQFCWLYLLKVLHYMAYGTNYFLFIEFPALNHARTRFCTHTHKPCTQILYCTVSISKGRKAVEAVMLTGCFIYRFRFLHVWEYISTRAWAGLNEGTMLTPDVWAVRSWNCLTFWLFDSFSPWNLCFGDYPHFKWMVAINIVVEVKTGKMYFI